MLPKMELTDLVLLGFREGRSEFVDRLYNLRELIQVYLSKLKRL